MSPHLVNSQDTSSLQLWWLGLGGFQIPKAMGGPWEAVPLQMTGPCWSYVWISRKNPKNAVVALANMVLSFQPVARTKAQVQIKVKHPRSVLASPARAVLSAMHARLVNLAA